MRITRIVEATRQELAARLAPMAGRHGELWLQRSRPGGLDDRCRRLERLLAVYADPSAGK